MSKRLVLLLALGLLAAPGCGRKGPLVLPPGRAPLPVEGLAAEVAEGRVVLRWTNPAKMISGRPIGSIRAVEVWVFDRGVPDGAGPLSSERIERAARLARTIRGPELTALAAGEGPPGAVTFVYELPPAPAAPERLAFAVRVIDGRRRASAFVGPVAVEIPKKDGGLDPAPPQGVS